MATLPTLRWLPAYYNLTLLIEMSLGFILSRLELISAFSLLIKSLNL